jgi:Short C-terminal domain
LGLIITAFSTTDSEANYKAEMLHAQWQQTEAVQKLQSDRENAQQISTNSIADEIEKLRKLKEDNLLTEEEFQMLKKKLIS